MPADELYMNHTASTGMVAQTYMAIKPWIYGCWVSEERVVSGWGVRGMVGLEKSYKKEVGWDK